jgi:hypothetical protein
MTRIATYTFDIHKFPAHHPSALFPVILFGVIYLFKALVDESETHLPPTQYVLLNIYNGCEISCSG